MVLPWLAAGWIAGVAAAPLIALTAWQWLALTAVAAFGAVATRSSRALRLAFAAVACLGLGSARTQADLDRLASAPIARIRGPVEGIGRVHGVPVRRADRLVVDLDAKSISSGDGPSAAVTGRLRGFFDPGTTLRRGETVAVRGVLLPPLGPDRGEVSAVLEVDDVRRLAPPPPGLTSSLDMLRQTILARLHAVLPAGEASLVAGVVLGIDETMPEALREDFRTTGTAHILVVSGFNVTIVAAAVLAGFRAAFGARKALLAAAIAVVAYTLLAGADPPVVRAAIMAGILLVAARLGRQPHALSALSAAAILMTGAAPAVVRDVGFQLSFFATLGLVVAGRPLTDRLRQWSERSVPIEGLRPFVLVFGETLLITLVAQVATLPITLYAFGRVPWLALPANALILPAQPALMAAGAGTAIAALVSLPIGRLAAWAAWPFAAYTIRVTQAFADVPGASPSLPPLPWIVPVGLYAVLGGLVWLAGSRWWSSAVDLVRRFAAIPLLLGIGLLTVGVWKTASERPDGRLRVTALPAGAIVVESPTGRFLVISAAESQAGLAASLDPHLPLTHPRLDWLLLANPEASEEDVDRALGQHTPEAILHISGAPPASSQIPRLGFSPRNVPAETGTRMRLGGGATLEILEARPGRWAARVSMGSAEILILEASPERLPAAFGARPATAVVVFGSGRRVAAALRTDWRGPPPRFLVGCPVPGDPFSVDLDPSAWPTRLTTPRHGWIRIETDGGTIRVEAERGG